MAIGHPGVLLIAIRMSCLRNHAGHFIFCFCSLKKKSCSTPEYKPFLSRRDYILFPVYIYSSGRKHALRKTASPEPNMCSFGKKKRKQQKKAQGVVLMTGASRIWKFVKPNLLRVYYVDLLGLFMIFHKLRASCGRPQCVLPHFAETCSVSSSIPITQSPPSPLSKPPPSSWLLVLFLVSCVMSIYLSIDLSVHFFRLVC